MKRMLRLLPALALLGLAACSGLSGCTTVGGEPVPIAASTMTDEKVLYAAEAALNGVSQVAFEAATTGLLDQAQSDALADKLEIAWGGLQDARCIHAALNGAPVAADHCASAIAEHGDDYRGLALKALTLAAEIQGEITGKGSAK